MADALDECDSKSAACGGIAVRHSAFARMSAVQLDASRPPRSDRPVEAPAGERSPTQRCSPPACISSRRCPTYRSRRRSCCPDRQRPGPPSPSSPPEPPAPPKPNISRDRTRYRLLETVHLYAQEKLAASGEADTVRSRGYTITTLGFGLVINPTWASLWGYVFLGAVVGAIVMLGRPFPALNAVLPVLAAIVVTMLATWFVADAANDGLLRVISPPLVAILPGLALTIAAMELASAQVISGASRLIYGVAQLMLLVFGVGLGMHIAGRVAPQQPSPQMGGWSLYVAVIVIAIGLYIYLSAPRGSMLWLILAIGVALVGQKVGGLFLSPTHSGAVGACLVVPFAMLGARLKTSPPAIVMMLAAFWALVPGALSFEELGRAAAGAGDISTLGVTVAAIFSIALGTLIGWSVFATINTRRGR